MKKLLLCTLILSFVLGNICLAKPINKNKSSTPNWDALEKRKDELEKKINDLLGTHAFDLISSAEKDQKINDFKQQIEEEKNKAPEVIETKKEIEELSKKIDAFLKEKYPTDFEKIQKLNKQSMKRDLAIYNIATKDPYLKKLWDTLNAKYVPIMVFSNAAIEELNKKVEQRKNELRYKFKPELKELDEELEKLQTKAKEIFENPEVKELVNKIFKISKQRMEEFKKIKKQVFEEEDKYYKNHKESKTVEEESPEKSMDDFLKKRVKITHKISPKIKKIDMEIETLGKKSKSIMEKLLVEIKKKEAQPKDNTANKGLDQKIKNLQKQKEELMQKDKEIYEARKAALKPGTAGMTMPPHYNEIRAIDEQIKELEKQR